MEKIHAIIQIFRSFIINTILIFHFDFTQFFKFIFEIILFYLLQYELYLSYCFYIRFRHYLYNGKRESN